MKIIIEGKGFEIEAEVFNSMEYFKDVQALNISPLTQIQFNSPIINEQIWNLIIKILQKYNYQLPAVSKVKSNCVEDYLPPFLIQLFSSISLQKLNKLYNAVSFLKVKGMRILIAAYFAPRVYIDKKKQNYVRVAESMGVKTALTTELINAYKQKQPNLN